MTDEPICKKCGDMFSCPTALFALRDNIAFKISLGLGVSRKMEDEIRCLRNFVWDFGSVLPNLSAKFDPIVLKK